jgi:hypothetical protein
MIRYLRHKEIDFKKYDTCVLEAVNSKPYALSWYLDAVASGWDVLVLEDYKAVMPLPKKKKWGINYIYQPYWIQHLGIFSTISLTDDVVEKFMTNVPKKFRLIDYNVNFRTKNCDNCINYILALNKNYKSLFKAFSKGRKSSINQAKKAGLKIKEIDDWYPIIKLFKQNKGLNIDISDSAYLKLEKLLKSAQELEQLKVITVNTKDNTLLGGAFFIISASRVTYLFSAIDMQGRRLQAMSYLLSAVIETYSERACIFDFEGSMLPSVAAFFRSFGSQKETYFHLKKRQLF